ALLMSGLAALAIARSRAASVAARSRDLALLQALGASPGDLKAVVLLEAALLGGGGGLAGVALGRLAALGGDLLARRLLPDLPFRPESLFAFPAWLLAAGLLVAAGAAVLGALAPATAASRVDPARTLS
ncbi:MAG: ABC transporter permease, partial [Anaeromyxobacteraceae bacterium]|nr:ABC transporter permease [Anaeromyxobacteraceae bacterium]